MAPLPHPRPPRPLPAPQPPAAAPAPSYVPPASVHEARAALEKTINAPAASHPTERAPVAPAPVRGACLLLRSTGLHAAARLHLVGRVHAANRAHYCLDFDLPNRPATRTPALPSLPT